MPVSQNKVVTSQALDDWLAICTTAKTTLNDAVNAVRLGVAGINGAIVYSLRAMPRMTVTAVQLQLYKSKDAGVTLVLVDLAAMAAYTLAATTAPATEADFGFSEAAPFRMAPNEELWVGIGVTFASGIAFNATVEQL